LDEGNRLSLFILFSSRSLLTYVTNRMHLHYMYLSREEGMRDAALL